MSGPVPGRAFAGYDVQSELGKGGMGKVFLVVNPHLGRREALKVLNLDADEATRARAVSAAKATVGRAARFIGQQAVQLHGAMGMTEELAIGHYFKRLTAIQYEFGTTDHHLARYAELTKG